jgi:hypothetical protein
LFKTEVALWDAISFSSRMMRFDLYIEFMNGLFNHHTRDDENEQVWIFKRNSSIKRLLHAYGSDAWDLVKAATQIFVMHQCGRLSDIHWILTHHQAGEGSLLRKVEQEYAAILLEEHRRLPQILPYIELARQKLSELPLKKFFPIGTDKRSYGLLRQRVESPLLIELIWSYWHEQGMLVQAINAVALRFQNIQTDILADPLRNLSIDPLRPANNLLWGYIQDEGNRLTVVRRSYEYAHQYGLELIGKAIPPMHTVERRSKFIEAFHNLLNACTTFFRERDDLTVKADGFPLLNAITDVHLLLAEGADNQFGDLPWTARCEMMQQQWLLARPELRDFLGGRIMVPYPEAWMDRVDTMKTLQGWTDTSITNFYWLALYGEQILLSIRYGNWSVINDAATAVAWADKWRPAIQSYVHHYRTVTGVDLSAEVVSTQDGADRYLQPSVLLLRRLQQQLGPAEGPRLGAQARRALLPDGQGSGMGALPAAPARSMLPGPRGRDQRTLPRGGD